MGVTAVLVRLLVSDEVVAELIPRTEVPTVDEVRASMLWVLVTARDN